jgi:catechol O-methyltransferase
MSELKAKPARRMDDGREEAMLQHVLANCVQGDPESVLNSIDSFAWSGTWMMNVGDRKGLILDDEVKLVQPQIAVEVGGYCGYSAVRIARLLPAGGRLFSLELEPRFAAIAEQIVRAAGLSDRVQHIIGPSDQSLRRLREITGRDHVDLFFLDHWKDLYLADIQTIEECRLLRAGTVVVADNVIYPGTPEYLAYVRAHQRFRSTFHASQLEYSNDIADGIEVSVYLGHE